MKFARYCFFSLLILLTGCEDKNEIVQDVNDPNLVAIEFFDAIYNQKDVKKAARVCSPRLARILLSYQSPVAVGRHLFNMSFDQVVITPNDTGVKVREQYRNEARLTIFFEGTYNDNRVEDVKRIKMVQKKGKWIVDKILKDPF